MEVIDLSWNVNKINRNNNKLLPKSIRGIIGKVWLWKNDAITKFTFKTWLVGL